MKNGLLPATEATFSMSFSCPVVGGLNLKNPNTTVSQLMISL